MNKIYRILFKKKTTTKQQHKTLVHLFFLYLIAAVELEVRHLLFSKEYLEFSHLVLILLHPFSSISFAQSIVPGSPFVFISFFSPRDRAHSLHWYLP